MNCGSLVDGIYVLLLLSLVSLAMMLLAVETQVSDRCNNEPNTTNAKPVTTATIPYIKGTFETIAGILQPYNIICVTHKLITTLRQFLTSVKDKDEPNDRQGAVYKIKCCECQASYIGETGRNLNIRLTEHKRVTKNGDVHKHLHTNHRIDWDSVKCITYSTDYYK